MYEPETCRVSHSTKLNSRAAVSPHCLPAVPRQPGPRQPKGIPVSTSAELSPWKGDCQSLAQVNVIAHATAFSPSDAEVCSCLTLTHPSGAGGMGRAGPSRDPEISAPSGSVPLNRQVRFAVTRYRRSYETCRQEP